MTDITGTSYSSIYSSVQAVGTLTSSVGGRSPQTTELPDDLASSLYASHHITVPSSKTASVLGASIYIGENIVGVLKSLVKAAEASASSQTYIYADITVADGTRVSRGNFASDIGRTLAHIQELVDSTEYSGGSILSSSSRDFSFQTSEYGGKINIAPQPIDLKGLNLEDLDLLSDSGLATATINLKRAVTIAEKRVQGLRALDSALNGSGSLSDVLNLLQSNGASELRGVLVNLYA